jgi:hypothetical protein
MNANLDEEALLGCHVKSFVEQNPSSCTETLSLRVTLGDLHPPDGAIFRTPITMRCVKKNVSQHDPEQMPLFYIGQALYYV